MNIYNVNDFTYGVELEIADVDTRIKLPRNNKWDFKDYTIANTCGVCNDPKKEFTIYGGEINTEPANTVEEQVENIKEIFNVLGERKSINHTTNMHIHVGVPGLSSDLHALKKLAVYIYENQEDAFSITEDLREPLISDFINEEEFKGAKKRYHRRKVSHQNKLRKNVLDKLLSATTPKEFYEFFAPLGKNGKRQWQLVTRCGINLMQLFNETDTVEFRHFTTTFNLFEIKSSIEWCKLFMEGALISGKTPKDIIKENDWMRFPKFGEYNHRRQKILEMTSVGKLSRKQVKENINKLLEQGEILKKDLYGEE